jgi:hypothetical protein
MLVATCATALESVAGGAAAAVPTATPTQLPPPVAGQTVNAALRSGTVRYRLPNARQFVDLTTPVQVPLGTTFDTTRGRVTLRSASDAAGGTQKAWFYEGTFTVSQSAGAAPITTLTLAGAKPACTTTTSGRATKKRRTRHLWGDGKGRFRTSGQFSSATVRGTRWVVEDRCDGTLTRVVRGVVFVRDFRRHVTVLVRAGHEYLARAR